MTWKPPEESAFYISPLTNIERFHHDIALAQMLAADHLFVFTTKSGDFAFAVNCNDFFAPAADSEDVKFRDLKSAYVLWYEHGSRGLEKWACLKRGERPMKYVVEKWKKDGFWDELLEALPQRNN